MADAQGRVGGQPDDADAEPAPLEDRERGERHVLHRGGRAQVRREVDRLRSSRGSRGTALGRSRTHGSRTPTPRSRCAPSLRPWGRPGNRTRSPARCSCPRRRARACAGPGRARPQGRWGLDRPARGSALRRCTQRPEQLGRAAERAPLLVVREEPAVLVAREEDRHLDARLRAGRDGGRVVAGRLAIAAGGREQREQRQRGERRARPGGHRPPRRDPRTRQPPIRFTNGHDAIDERLLVVAVELGPRRERARILHPVDEDRAVEVVVLVLERPRREPARDALEGLARRGPSR